MIGIVHPGSMGAAVAGGLVAAGHPVAWASEGRGPDTRGRAERAGLTDLATLARLGDECDVVLSICPPQGARDVAEALRGYPGLFVDANAISPELTIEIGAVIAAGGGRFVDGGIIGGPPRRAGTTRLYLSGADAGRIAELFAGTPLEVRVLPGAQPGAASALKMSYAAWTKITAALSVVIRASARATGVEDALLAEWERGHSGLAERSARAGTTALERGWRWAAEMEQIAETFAAVGLPGSFGLAAAEVFASMPRPAEGATFPGPDDLAAAIAALRTG
jgi:3-hydroxyisobutyrate dehydrogenase-like beta-hydroxyacid dehydrogenase